MHRLWAVQEENKWGPVKKREKGHKDGEGRTSKYAEVIFFNFLHAFRSNISEIKFAFVKTLFSNDIR